MNDFNSDVGTIDFRSRKGRGKEKSYSCVLTDEGIRFFKQAVPVERAGVSSSRKTMAGHGRNRIRPARCRRPARGQQSSLPSAFTILRHTWASHAVMNGTRFWWWQEPGHADTRMVEKHYGHLAPSYITDAIREGAPRFGFKPSNVKPMRAPR